MNLRTIFELFLSGLLFGSGPCLLTCGPPLISYLAGTKKNVKTGLMAYLLFSAARISVYLILGLAVFVAGRIATESMLGNLSRYVLIFGGLFVIIVGGFIILGKRLELKLWQQAYGFFLERDKKSITALGLILGLLPCAPFLAVISYIGLIAKTWWQNIAYGISFGLGTFFSPLIFLVMLSGLIFRFSLKRGSFYYKIVNLLCGLVLIFFGVRLIITAL